MKKIIMFLLAAMGINTACSQDKFGDTDVTGFSKLISGSGVTILDVRTAQEYAEGHIEGALNIDVKDDRFLQTAEQQLSKENTIAVYCRSGKRSASAAALLADKGYKVVNLEGGIMAWQQHHMPTTTDTHEVDIFTTQSSKSLRFYALMHASIRLVYDGKEIEIDPVRQLGDRKTDYTLMPKADYILVTHEHGDHFDQEAIRMLSKENTMLITNRRCADMLGYGEVMANGDNLELEGMTIEAVPAYNVTEGHLQFHPKGRDNGFILTIDGTRIYIAGDTEDIPEMAGIKDIDIAFLPCNQPYTTTTGQLLNAARTIKPKTLIPYHYGQTDLKGVASQLEGIDVRIRDGFSQ